MPVSAPAVKRDAAHPGGTGRLLMLAGLLHQGDGVAAEPLRGCGVLAKLDAEFGLKIADARGHNGPQPRLARDFHQIADLDGCLHVPLRAVVPGRSVGRSRGKLKLAQG